MPKTLLLLGAGELGKEFTISAKRLGCWVIAVDRYAGAPAMQVADCFEVINMLDGKQLEEVVRHYRPDYVIPEIEAIRTEKLLDLEKEGFNIIPNARAVNLTMNRDAIRNLASNKLKLRTAHYGYAESKEELIKTAHQIGFPCVIKPIMSSSGKGQSVAKNPGDLGESWTYAIQNMRGDRPKVIVEEFIPFDYEITLLTIRQRKGPTLFVKPIGHRQERGDYQESWLPAQMSSKHLKEAQKMAKKVTDELGGVGLFGVEFFVTKKEVIFSELSPRPHDTGMVTLISQNLSEFDLHLRAVLGLPIPEITYYGASASAVILADRDANGVSYRGVEAALKTPDTDVRLFGKTSSRAYRRMGVALARAKDTQTARKKAVSAAKQVHIVYQ